MAAREPNSTPIKKKKGTRRLKHAIGWTTGVLALIVAAVVTQLILDNIATAANTNPCDTHAGLTRITAVSVAADSIRSPQPPLDYNADNLNDNDPATVWVEGDTDGYGEGETLRFTLPANTDLQLICIVNGFARSEGQYAKNSRVEQLSVETDRGTQRSVLPDKAAEDFARRQAITFTKGPTSQVTFILEEARAASGVDAAKDMSISDILFWARP